MSLLERYRANACAVVECEKPRCEDAAVCQGHLNALWRRELTRLEDGTYVERRRLVARDYTADIRSAA